MSPHNAKNFVYFAANKQQGKTKDKDSISDQKLQKILESLYKQAIREKTPELEDLDQIIRDSLKSSVDEKLEGQDTDDPSQDESFSITKYLIAKGYMRDEKNWLTNKGFFEIGNKILQDVMKELSSDEFGLHNTNSFGDGNVTIDTTKNFELGDDIRFLSVPHTILNAVQRISKTGKAQFPISIETDDLEEFETIEDVRVAVVYCIDLSSTMKSILGKGGKSRIESAKKALWSLYALNKKYFPNDSIYVIGFASMASQVNPFDIPFLKTYDANDNFLHYTNYQAAFRLARKILQKNTAQNKRIVMITDGQPSACFIENDSQKNEILSDKPYSNFYSPEESLIYKVKKERNMKLDIDEGRLVYLCYRYKKVDPKINELTVFEARRCKRDGIEIDSIVVSDESELLDYIQDLEKELKGKTYHINDENMDKVLVHDYLAKTRKVLSSKQNI
jgi:uncharacterized protein with von Willebrand factor type A (vWA) domain